MGRQGYAPLHVGNPSNSCFSVQQPFVTVSANEDWPMRKILLVEDDALVARIYSRKLSEQFEVAVAEDGVAAMQRLKDFKPELVVLDLLMPRLSGMDVLKFMRQQPATKATKVIVFSNAFLDQVDQEVAGLGIEEVLSKGATTPALLIEKINSVLQRPDNQETPTPSATTEPKPVDANPAFQPAVPAPAKPAPRPGQSFVKSESAADFRHRIRRDFFEQIPAISESSRQTLKKFLEASDPHTRMTELEALSRKIRFLNQMTGMAGCYRISQLANALEALLYELQEKPAVLNESLRHTINSTVHLLVEWLQTADRPDEQCLSPTTVLVVDDDAVSNRAVVFALSRASVTAKSVTDPFKALEQLKVNSFDSILLDINLPGISGFTLCEQMRNLPLHKNTPVIFITGHAEFEKRAREMLNTGDDFISKPILPMELTVKITAHVLRRRMASSST
jgi:CheY-like chemotaxis protein